MKLESARELKANFASMLTGDAVAAGAGWEGGDFVFSPDSVRTFDVHTQRLDLLAQHQPVVATGIQRGTKNDYKLAVRIQRRAFEDSPPVEEIRRQAKGEVDVRYVGSIVKRAVPWNRRRERPVLIGSSVGHFRVTAGTVGCFTRPGVKGAGATLLSNNHVLADENKGKGGDAVLQPGAYDKGREDRDRIGSLSTFVPLSANQANAVDCALCALDDATTYDAAALHGLGPLTGPVDDNLLPEVEEVEKVGRTTGHSKGRITAFELDRVTVGYDLGQLRFDGQVEIEGAGMLPFSDGGDSGSVIFTSGDRRACALLFAGSDQGGTNGKGLTYANPLGTVLTELACELIT